MKCCAETLNLTECPSQNLHFPSVKKQRTGGLHDKIIQNYQRYATQTVLQATSANTECVRVRGWRRLPTEEAH